MNANLPTDLTSFRRTSIYTQHTMPKVLFDSHHATHNVWGLIHVQKGELEYHIDAIEPEKILVKSGMPCIIEPDVDHHIEAAQDVEFFIEFCH